MLRLWGMNSQSAHLDELEVPAEGGGDHYARFAKHWDRFEQVANAIHSWDGRYWTGVN